MASNNTPGTANGSFWQRNGKGPIYRGTYVRDMWGQRTFVLMRVVNAKVDAKSYESHEMAKQFGWSIVTRAVIRKLRAAKK